MHSYSAVMPQCLSRRQLEETILRRNPGSLLHLARSARHDVANSRRLHCVIRHPVQSHNVPHDEVLSRDAAFTSNVPLATAYGGAFGILPEFACYDQVNSSRLGD